MNLDYFGCNPVEANLKPGLTYLEITFASILWLFWVEKSGPLIPDSFQTLVQMSYLYLQMAGSYECSAEGKWTWMLYQTRASDLLDNFWNSDLIMDFKNPFKYPA